MEEEFEEAELKYEEEKAELEEIKRVEGVKGDIAGNKKRSGSSRTAGTGASLYQ